MKVGFSYWGVWNSRDITQTLDTPDGHRYGRELFMREIISRGNELVIMQERRDAYFLGADYPLEGISTISDVFPKKKSSVKKTIFPDIDVIFMEWRWPTWKNDKTHPKHDAGQYEPDLDRQREILEFYHGKVPIIIWDADLKVTPEDERAYPELILTDPSFDTSPLTRKRTSLPFWTDWLPFIPTAEPYPIYGYIGNNYERDGEFKKYYFNIGRDARTANFQVSMYGNWLQYSPERVSPESLIRAHREISFNHRMSWMDSMKIMNRFIATTHVSKPRYYDTGFMSPRYLEALSVGCPAFVPDAFKYSSILGDKWSISHSVALRDNIIALKNLELSERDIVVQEQKEALKQFGVANGIRFDVKETIDFIESCVK